jgi:hypothetical protein
MNVVPRCIQLCCTLVAVVVAVTFVRWHAWLIFDTYPLQGCAAARAKHAASPQQQPVLLGSDAFEYLLLNLNRSSDRRRAVSRELAAAGLRKWTHVVSVDTLVEGTSLHSMAQAFAKGSPNGAGTIAIKAGLERQWRGHHGGYLLALQASLVRALRRGLAMRRARPQLRWLVILEDDALLGRDFEPRLRRLATALPHADLLWLDERSWRRAWVYGEPSCCTVAVAVNVDAAHRLAAMMTPGSEALDRHLARRLVRASGTPPAPWPQHLYLPAAWATGEPHEPPMPKYDLVLSDFCVNDGLCCTVRDLARPRPKVPSTDRSLPRGASHGPSHTDRTVAASRYTHT